ncbi:MAG: AI-2E family transporter [Lachnospiraceae bacterium]|nr:AI-2E family transporter [Lachnospiraceae bacterium]
MKFNFDKRYLKLCKYIGVTTVIIYLAFRLIDSIPFLYDNIMSLFGSIWDMSFPIILGFIIAFLMLGPVNAIEKLLKKSKFFSKHGGACRAIGIVTSYLVVLGFLISLLIGIYFMIGGQISQNSTLSNILVSITEYFESSSFSTESLTNLISNLKLPFGDVISSQMGNIASFLQSLITGLFSGVADFVISLGSNIFTLVIALTCSIYVIASREFFSDIWDKFFFIIFRKRKSGVVIRRALGIIKTTFSKYIHGQLIEASIVAVMSTIILYIIGVDYAIVLGLVCGIFNLIPYIGPFIGTAIAAVFTLFSGDIWMVVAVIVCLVIVQQIDCNILCPKIVGDIVGLHPALVLIAVTIGGNMNGLLGMIIAVPIAASLKTLIADWFATYMKADYDKHKKEANDIVSDDDPIFETLKRKNSKAQKTVVVNEDNEAVATVEDNTDNK